MSQPQQDELAQLFARNMNFTQDLTHPATPDKQFFTRESIQPQTVYSSMHYTGTSYLVPTESSEDTRADSPFSVPIDDLETTLRRHDIDPASLSPSQIKLFTNADYEQRLRLLELWRISPPDGGHLPGASWCSTSLAQEEELARLRHERHISEQSVHNSTDSMDDHEVEPYVKAGYANAQRLDPVYAAAAGLWQAPNYAGDFDPIRERHGVHQQGHQVPFYGHTQEVQNDEMVM